jgi:predicted component of type VI protein secretion system
MALMLTVTEPQELLPGLQSTMVFGTKGGCIGRGRDNDWVLPDPLRYLSTHHARVRCHQGRFFVEDTSTNGVFLNESTRPLGRDASPPLKDGDELRLGGYRMRVAINTGDSAESTGLGPIALESGMEESHSVEALLIDHSDSVPVLTDSELYSAPPTTPAAARITERRKLPRLANGVTAEVDAFCRGAGIAATQVPPGTQLLMLQTAGLILREALVGARELDKRRREPGTGANQTAASDDTNRVALQGLSIEQLLLQLLVAKNADLPEAVPWLRDVFDQARK